MTLYKRQTVQTLDDTARTIRPHSWIRYSISYRLNSVRLNRFTKEQL